MRLRVLITVLVAVVALTAAINYWPFAGGAEPSRQSKMLKACFLGYTNGNAVIQIKNRASQAVHLHHALYVYTKDPFRIVDFYEITNASKLSAGATLVASFPAPTSRGYWRAEVGGVGEYEARIKHTLHRTWPLRHHPFALYVRYAQTDWIKP